MSEFLNFIFSILACGFLGITSLFLLILTSYKDVIWYVILNEGEDYE